MFEFDPTKYGAVKVKGVQGINQPGTQTNTPDITSQQDSSQPQKSGFFSSIINDAYTNLIAKPATRFGQALAAPIVYGFGSDQTKQNYRNELQKDVQVPNGILPGGPVTVPAQKGFGDGGAKQIVGDAAQAASYLIPEAKVIENPILRGIATGATSGALYGAGSVAEQGGSVGDIAMGGVKGGVAGGVTGGAISSVGPAVRAVNNNIIKPVGKFVTSNLTGFDRSTIETIIKNPSAVKPEMADTLNREYLGNKVHDAVTTRLDDLSGLGKEYQTIRDSRSPVEIPTETAQVPVLDPKTGSPAINPQTGQPMTQPQKVNSLVTSVFKKFGLELDPQTGSIRTSPDSVPLAPGDKAALESFYNEYGKYTDLNANSFLNARKALDNLAEFSKDPSKTDISNVIAKDLRKVYDQVGGVQVPGLKELDAKFAPERKALTQIRKDYLNPDGTLKDNSLNKLANLGSKGKSIVLNRLEKIVPGIGEDVNIVRALEDIKDSSGIKVGTYIKSGVVGGAVGGPWGALIGLVLSTPQVALPIIKTYARGRNIAEPVIDRILNNMKRGKPVSDAVKRLIYASFADLVTQDSVKKDENKVEVPANTEAYLKSLGI